MIEQAKTYLQKYFPIDSILGGQGEVREDLKFNNFQLPPSMQVVMFLLKISPWVCGLGFGSTFLLMLNHDFASGTNPGFLQNLSEFYLQYEPTLRAANIVCISGLIGFGTNFLAIRMLFRPVDRRPIWGQGLVPSQKDRIIYSLAQGMHKHILSQELIRKRVEDTGLVKRLNDLVMDGSIGILQDNDLRQELKEAIFQSIVDFSDREDVRKDIREMIDLRLEQNLDGGMKKFLLQTYKRYSRDDYEAAIDKIVQDLPKIAKEVMDKMEGQLNTLAAYIRLNKTITEDKIMEVFVDLLNRIDITNLLAKQMEHFDEAKLERMVWEATNEQLLYIQYLGTILGILGGLLIWKPGLMGAIYALAFLGLYGLDQLLFRLKKNKAA
ncbi:MAG: DUF445 family protein [Bacteroidota bacterium]